MTATATTAFTMDLLGLQCEVTVGVPTAAPLAAVTG